MRTAPTGRHLVVSFTFSSLGLSCPSCGPWTVRWRWPACDFSPCRLCRRDRSSPCRACSGAFRFRRPCRRCGSTSVSSPSLVSVFQNVVTNLDQMEQRKLGSFPILVCAALRARPKRTFRTSVLSRRPWSSSRRRAPPPSPARVLPIIAVGGPTSDAAVTGEEAGLLAGIDEQRRLAARSGLAPMDDVGWDTLPGFAVEVEPFVAGIRLVDGEAGSRHVGMIAALLEWKPDLCRFGQLGVLVPSPNLGRARRIFWLPGRVRLSTQRKNGDDTEGNIAGHATLLGRSHMNVVAVFNNTGRPSCSSPLGCETNSVSVLLFLGDTAIGSRRV